MHCEHLVVQVGIEDLAFWKSKLETNQNRFKTADQKEKHGCCHVHDAELFVIDSKYPLAPALCNNRALECTHGRCRRGEVFNIGHEILRLLQREQVGNEFFDIRFAQTEVWHSAIFATSVGQ